ncbi:MAG: MFS superfamily sulfate permease-like transporter/mannitol [Chlamydiales bacterium]|jgi:MFS superfamily sulfate permease-like transporter/mannitol/fructose-specific phosphotransferase system IIA component (Ntr-type)
MTDGETEQAHGGKLAWRANVGPSIVVLLISIPLSMGIAIASGVPPARGLVTAIIGGLVIGKLSGSPLQISGPSAGLAVMVLDTVQTHGLRSLAVVVPLMGITQAAAGLAKIGQLFRAVSPAVINGMLAGIGVLIFSAQFHVAVDDLPKGSGLDNLLSIPGAIVKGVAPSGDLAHREAAMIGLLTLIVVVSMSALRKTPLRRVPPALAAVAVAALAVQIFDLPVRMVDMPNSLMDALAPIQGSQLRELLSPAMILTALPLAFVASAETLLCATAVDAMHDGDRTDYDRELFAQGVGNILCGLVGAMPTTGVITRSTANVQAGATTRASAVMLGAWLLAVLALFPTAFEVIPRSSLAALLVYIGYKLFRGRPYAELHAHGRSEMAIFTATLVTIVAFNLLAGIVVGFLLATAKLLLSGGKQFHRFEIKRLEEEGRTHLHLVGAASFIRLPRLAAALEGLEDDREVHLHVEELDYIDHACLELLDRWECARIRSRSPVRVEWQTLRHRYHQKNRLDPVPEEHSESPSGDSQLLDFVTADHILIAPELRDRWHAIEVMSEALATRLGMSPADLTASVKEREIEAPTYLGRGLMIPHGTLPEKYPMAGMIAVSEEGWDFDTSDGERVHCIALLATPPSEASRHLAVLAALARVFHMEPEVRDRLVSARTQEEAIHALAGEHAKSVNYPFESRDA